MGYRIRNIFAVSPNDTHSYFLYVIPGKSFEFKWIAEWIEDNFNSIASSMGPEGVIIAPTPNHDEEYLMGMTGLSSGGCFFYSNYSVITGKPSWWDFFSKEKNGSGYKREQDEEYQKYDNEFSKQEGFLHSSKPKMIFCQTPLEKENENTESLIIDLTTFENEKELGKLFDLIASIIMQSEKIEMLEIKKDDEETEINNLKLSEIFHLKPNIFGVGINFNYLLHLLNHKLMEKKRKQP